jgi:hypothetical protein
MSRAMRVRIIAAKELSPTGVILNQTKILPPFVILSEAKDLTGGRIIRYRLRLLYRKKAKKNREYANLS